MFKQMFYHCKDLKQMKNVHKFWQYLQILDKMGQILEILKRNKVKTKRFNKFLKGLIREQF